MKKNMGTIDKTIRLLIALVILILAVAKVITGTAAVILIILAGVFVITSLLGFCPFYLPFGFNTNRKKA